MHPYYRETYGYAAQELPVAASLYPQLVTLPVYPDMTETQVAYVCDSIKEILARHTGRVLTEGPRPVRESNS
jgi:perosamine synthetase